MAYSTAISLPELSLQNALLGIITENGRLGHEQHPHKSRNVNFQENNVLYDMRTNTFPPFIYVLKMRVEKTIKIEYAVAQESDKLDYRLKKWEPLKELLDPVISKIE